MGSLSFYAILGHHFFIDSEEFDPCTGLFSFLDQANNTWEGEYYFHSFVGHDNYMLLIKPVALTLFVSGV